MNRISTHVALSILAIAGSGLIVGCGPHYNESDKIHAQAEGMENAADLISRGEKNVADGKAEIARGEALKDQHNDLDGDKLIAEGKAKKAQGEEEIAQGRKIKDHAD